MDPRSMRSSPKHNESTRKSTAPSEEDDSTTQDEEQSPSPQARAAQENAIRAASSGTKQLHARSSENLRPGNCATNYCQTCGCQVTHLVPSTPPHAPTTNSRYDASAASSHTIRQQSSDSNPSKIDRIAIEQAQANHFCGDWCLYRTPRQGRASIPWCPMSNEHVVGLNNKEDYPSWPYHHLV